jgi:putative DNA primase/helicase
MASTIDDVLRQMAERGIEPPSKPIYADGKKHTWAGTPNKPTKKNAWCILNEWTSPRNGQTYINGVYGMGDQSNYFKVEHEQKEWSPAEKSDWLAKRKEIERAAEDDRKITATAAADKAKKHWDGANETGGSTYLERKQVGAYGVRFIYGKVLVPLFDTSDKLHGLQWIQEDGSKVFGTGTVKEGHFHLIGSITEGLPLAFAEGYATAATVHMATGWPVVVCFDAGNLMPVVAEFRKLYDAHEFIIAGDDDKHLVARLCERLQLVGVTVTPEDFGLKAGGLGDRQWTLPAAKDGDAPMMVTLTAKYGSDRNDVRLIEGSISVGDETKPLRLENAGRAKAMAAAKKHGARAIFPRFASRSERHSDFNDMHVAEGLPAVRELLLAPPPVVVVKQKKSTAQPAGEEGGNRGYGGNPDDVPDSWSDGRKWLNFPYKTDKGEVKGIRENVYFAFKEDPLLQGLVRFNEFSHRLDKTRSAPWDGPTAVAGKWGALDDLRLANYLAASHRLIVANPVTIEQAVMMAASDSAYNPLKDYCESLVWDGVERRKTWLHTVLGAENSEYHTLVGTYFILSMIARVYEPGCQMDYMMILQGAQGAKKSSVLRILGGEYFAGGTFRVGDKDSLQVLQGRWIFNFNEIDSLNKSEATANKAFITERVDVFRPPYGKQFVDYPRSCVLTGDTNEDEFLKDGTGDRRSWVVHCADIDVEAMAAMRDQLIAEALHFYKAGDQRYPDKAIEDRVFKPKQEEWKFVDVWQDALARYVNGTAVTENYPGCTGSINDGQCRDRECFSTLELMVVGLKIEGNKIDNAGGQQKRVAKLMRALGFSKYKFSSGGRENGYKRTLVAQATNMPTLEVIPAAGMFLPAHAGSSVVVPDEVGAF